MTQKFNEIINIAKRFVEKSFKQNPHYSFDNWKIMYNHSLLTYEISQQICKEIECDKLVVALGSLLHDVGKSYKTDENTLMLKHRELGYIVCKDFLDSIRLTKEQKEKIKVFFFDKGRNIEKAVIEDADIVAFYKDKKLQDVFRKWAIEKELESELKKKLDFFTELKFDVSKKLAEPFYKNTKKYLKV